jgi:hypothetical protein
MNEDTSVVLQSAVANTAVVHVNGPTQIHNHSAHTSSNVTPIHQIVSNSGHGVIVQSPQVMGITLSVSGMFFSLILKYFCIFF